MRVLTVPQMHQLHEWLAARIPYPQLHDLMLAQFGRAICPGAVTWHRQQYAEEIAAIRTNQERQAERREKGRKSKARQRARRKGAA